VQRILLRSEGHHHADIVVDQIERSQPNTPGA
jgi:hypothetical protein